MLNFAAFGLASKYGVKLKPVNFLNGVKLKNRKPSQ